MVDRKTPKKEVSFKLNDPRYKVITKDEARRLLGLDY